jgi:FKBP-type peptidyl-prolyl cis-trans isomerase SlyD
MLAPKPATGPGTEPETTGRLCHDRLMRIQAPCVVSLTWTLMDGQNRPIDELKDPVEFFVGGDDLLAKVEEALLENAGAGELHLHLEPEHAFGDYRPELVCFEDRGLFPELLEVGMAYEGLPEGAKTEGMPTDAIYLVTEIYGSHVVLDGNHPLAGMALRLHLRVHAVRDATPAEIEAGSVGSGPFSLLSGSASASQDGGPTLH